MSTTTCEYGSPSAIVMRDNGSGFYLQAFSDILETDYGGSSTTIPGGIPNSVQVGIAFKESVCVSEGGSSGGSSYIIDVGSSLMLN